MSEEEIKKRYGEMETKEEELKEDIDLLNLPELYGPKIFLVKCKKGFEKDVTLNLFFKMLRLRKAGKDAKLPIN